MSEIIIIDEWLWADLNGENSETKQEEALKFLETLYKKCDKIVTAKGSKFQKKEWNFSKNSGKDITLRKIARFYFGFIKSNSEKYEEVKIEDNKEINLEDINPDDVYLVKIYKKVKAPVITTDEKLKKILDKNKIPCKLREEFIKKYLNFS